MQCEDTFDLIDFKQAAVFYSFCVSNKSSDLMGGHICFILRGDSSTGYSNFSDDLRGDKGTRGTFHFEGGLKC